MLLVTLLVMTLSAGNEPAPAHAGYRETTVAQGGRITGRVSFKGPVPQGAIERFPVSQKWPGCGTGFRDVVRIDVKDGALRGCFVMIEGITEGKAWPKLAAPPLLDQKKCRFTPSLLIVRSGAALTVRNSDPGVLHNVNLKENIDLASGRAVSKMLFNIAQPVTGDVKKKVKPEESPFITVGCDIHNFMVSHAVASEHPYVTTVDAGGAFSLDGVPPGVHKIVVWHPTLGKKRATVTVPPSGSVAIDFEYGQ